jgi:hypothetical protein
VDEVENFLEDDEDDEKYRMIAENKLWQDLPSFRDKEAFQRAQKAAIRGDDKELEELKRKVCFLLVHGKQNYECWRRTGTVSRL